MLRRLVKDSVSEGDNVVDGFGAEYVRLSDSVDVISSLLEGDVMLLIVPANVLEGVVSRVFVSEKLP
jgi:hypothetical protein